MRNLLFLFSLSLIGKVANCQVTITGATCVRSGIEYQYNITTSLDSAVATSICSVGGTIKGYTSSCISSAPLSYIHVLWNQNASNGQIQISSSDGSASISVQIAPPLIAGAIDSSGKLQLINPGNSPSPIMCSNAAGGSCSPVYEYQWQFSIDALNWDDIADQTDSVLHFNSRPTQSGFYRRKVTDVSASDVSYSDWASVFLMQ